MMRPGAGTRVRSWTPTAESQLGFLVTHNESISIADYFTLREKGKVTFRPTCHYAYHPCDDAVLSLHELAGRQWQAQEDWIILDEADIIDGIDELGVLLYGHDRNAYWYGSQLSIEETRDIAPYQNATGLQVTSAVLAGMVWALENPDAGIVEADEIDFARCLEVQMPYLGPVIGAYTDWTPLDGTRATDCSRRRSTLPTRGSSPTCWCARPRSRAGKARRPKPRRSASGKRYPRPVVLDRDFPQNRGAVHAPDFRRLHAAAGEVQRLAVVPHHEIARAPFVVIDEAPVGDMGEQRRPSSGWASASSMPRMPMVKRGEM